ncbi:MAG: hypothetical protein WDN06_09785 [Asticcacaulis sp.]
MRKPDAQGTSFYVELNGVAVFMKGANYIPNDSFLPRVTHAVYDKVIGSAADTHMNMIRIWGGGVYEDDYVYDLCDRHGILVWQDFMFALLDVSRRRRLPRQCAAGSDPERAAAAQPRLPGAVGRQ